MQKTLLINSLLAFAHAVQVEAQTEAELQATTEFFNFGNLGNSLGSGLAGSLGSSLSGKSSVGISNSFSTSIGSGLGGSGLGSGLGGGGLGLGGSSLGLGGSSLGSRLGSNSLGSSLGGQNYLSSARSSPQSYSSYAQKQPQAQVSYGGYDYPQQSQQVYGSSLQQQQVASPTEVQENPLETMTGMFDGKFSKDLPFPDDINEKAGAFGYDTEFEKGFSKPPGGEFGYDHEMQQDSEASTIYSNLQQEFQYPEAHQFDSNAEPHQFGKKRNKSETPYGVRGLSKMNNIAAMNPRSLISKGTLNKFKSYGDKFDGDAFNPLKRGSVTGVSNYGRYDNQQLYKDVSSQTQPYGNSYKNQVQKHEYPVTDGQHYATQGLHGYGQKAYQAPLKQDYGGYGQQSYARQQNQYGPTDSYSHGQGPLQYGAPYQDQGYGPNHGYGGGYGGSGYGGSGYDQYRGGYADQQMYW